MRVYNLTDQRLGPGKPFPQVLRISGFEIQPGGHTDFPDSFPLHRISGWMRAIWVSVDHLPTWYQQARRTPRPSSTVVTDAPLEEDEKLKKQRKRKKDD